ncbi:MAG: metallophosphoesterase [SAR324 cluster bacterium]|nr:metallophosphoesterase [SAR324 cluster bacterium]
MARKNEAQSLPARKMAPPWALLLAMLPLAMNMLAGCGDSALQTAEDGAGHEAAPLLKGWQARERPPSSPPVGSRWELVIVATSDLHGWITSSTLYPRGRPGGLAHLGPLIAGLRAEAPGLILLDGGDTVRGAPNLAYLARHQPAAVPPVLRLMNRLGYDAMALGNHDLEVGRAALNRWVSQSAFPWLSANTLRSGGQAFLPPYRIIERDGLRVAVLGLTTPGTAIWVDARHLAGLRIGDMLEAARRWVPKLREIERADVVIGLFHGGLNGWYDRAVALRHGLPLPNAAGLIADQGEGFDLIVSGHSHRFAPRRERNGDSAFTVPVVQPGARGEGLAVARLRLREIGGRWRVEGVTRSTLRAQLAPDPMLMREARGELAATRAWLAQATEVRFSKLPDRPVFRRCAGALSHMAALRLGPAALQPGDLADLASAARAVSLLPMMWRYVPPRQEELGAPVRRAHLHRWMRHGNPLVLARLQPRQAALLLGPFARHQSGQRARFSAVLYPGGLRAQMAPGGTEVLRLIREDGSPLSSNGNLPVWLTNYHWNGGGGLARQALLHPSQFAGRTRVPLRELVFRLLSDPGLELPPACRSYLAMH